MSSLLLSKWRTDKYLSIVEWRTEAWRELVQIETATVLEVLKGLSSKVEQIDHKEYCLLPFSEENVYMLCKKLSEVGLAAPDACDLFVVFISKPNRQMAHFIFTLRALVVISYFALTILFYMRAPSPSGVLLHLNSPDLKAASKYGSVGVFGDALVSMLGSVEQPFTVFIPSHTAFQNASSMFRKEQDVSDTNSAAYVVMSHLLSFSAVPKSILSKHIPFGKEVVYEALSGFIISVTRVRGKGLLVNNITCVETDLRRGRLVIHVLNGVLMDSEFAQSMVQDAVLNNEEDVKPDWEEEEQQEDK